MKKRFTQSVKNGAALVCAALLLAVSAGGLKAQNPWPDYDFKAANADGDTLYYRITSATAPYTVAVTRCHDSVYHTLPVPNSYQQGQPGFLYPVYDYDSLITIPSSVTHGGQTYTVNAIDKEAFYMQKDMHTVVLPASVVTIDSGAFYRSSLHQIVMSPNVTRINYYAFMSTPLESIDLPTGLTYIGELAFAYSSLSEVEIPAGVTVLPNEAFNRCPLTKITFHEGLQEIGWLAFSPQYIDSLVFPSSLRKLVALHDDFLHAEDTIQCRYVEFQSGPDPLELGVYCFLGFNKLETVILSDNLARLGMNCFQYTAIRQIVIPPLVDTIPEGCFAYCHSLSSVTLPENLKVIGKFAFGGTPLLKEISIPASVTLIGQRAFYVYGANGMEVVNCYADVPPFIDGGDGYPSFSKLDTIYVRVPCGTIAAYQSAPGWSSYSNFVYDDCLGVEDREPEAFKVWPNPVEDLLHVELSGKDIAGLALYDLQGRIIYSPDLSNLPINLRNVPAGVYLLRVTGADGREYRQKIVKR